MLLCLQSENLRKKEKQGKGTADHILTLVDYYPSYYLLSFLTLIVTGSKLNALSQGGGLRGPKKLSISIPKAINFYIIIRNDVLVYKKEFW